MAVRRRNPSVSLGPMLVCRENAEAVLYGSRA
jgi:hypothetical protein